MISIRGPSFSIMLSIGCMMLIIACALRRIYFCYYTRYKKKKLKPTLSGLIELLSNKHLLNEFTEFCRSDYCIENMMFFKEFWRYKNYYRIFSKNRSINNTDDTLNDEKSQTKSQLSYDEPQSIFKNQKIFLSIRKLFSNTSKSDPANTSVASCNTNNIKEIQPAYVAVNMEKNSTSEDDGSATNSESYKKEISPDRQSVLKKTCEIDEKHNISSDLKDEVDGISIHKNSIYENDKGNRSSLLKENSFDSNLSEYAVYNNIQNKLIYKNENKSMDLRSNARALNIIEEDNNACSSNKKIKSHVDVYNNLSSIENENLAKKILNEKSNFKSDRALERQIPIMNDGKLRNSSVLNSNLRYNETTSGMSSVNSMVNYKTMCNINQIDSMDNTHGSSDGIIKSSVISKSIYNQSYSSRMDLTETKKMLDGDIFKNVGQEMYLYDKKSANVKLHKYALQIYDKYICHGSIYELSIKNRTIKDISDKMSNTKDDQLFSEDIFNQAYIEVLQNLYLTSFQKYLKYGKKEIIYCKSFTREDSENLGENYKNFDFN
eukprot:jgi/Orpsp1_1/1184782/evm.model.c7180000090967.1